MRLKNCQRLHGNIKVFHITSLTYVFLLNSLEVYRFSSSFENGNNTVRELSIDAVWCLCSCSLNLVEVICVSTCTSWHRSYILSQLFFVWNEACSFGEILCSANKYFLPNVRSKFATVGWHKTLFNFVLWSEMYILNYMRFALIDLGAQLRSRYNNTRGQRGHDQSRGRY